MSARVYPAYRESGLNWIGLLPVSWSLIALKHLVAMQSGEQITAERIEAEGAFPVYGGNGLRGFTEAFTHDGHYALIGRQGALCGNVNFARGRFWASEHAVVCTPKGPYNVRWLGELLKAMELGQYSVTAAQPGLSVEAIGNLSVPVPPWSDQLAIASFLEHETGKIDALVAEQERLIALLKEKRQAVISHAITRGLNLNVPMKDSGVPWLGVLPATWIACRVGYLATVENGSTPDRENQLYWTGDCCIPWITSGEVNQYVVSEPSEFITPLALTQSSLRIIPKGAILVGLVGQGRTRAMAARMAMSGTINQNIAAIIPRTDIDSEFLHFVLESSYKYLREFGRGGNQAALNCEILRAFIVPVPPVAEQKQIVESLTKATTNLKALISEAIRAIVLLHERRAALISAAVTGKIDVREIASVSEAA